MISLTEKAAKKILSIMKEQKVSNDTVVRVGVKGGGCSGLVYDLTFDHVINDDDKIFEDNGVKVVCDKKSILYLAGTELDYSGGLNGKGFVFKNPNANRTCGCGESFSL